MKIIFMGTPTIAVQVLQALQGSVHDIVAIVTQTDKPKGRSGTPCAPPVKEYAIEFLPQVPIFQPLKAKEPDFIEKIEALNPDLAIVAAYGQILTQRLLDAPKLGSINVHFSLLPLLRGAAPIQRCLLQEMDRTGVTIMRMVKELDAGAILSQQEFAVEETITAGQLSERLAKISGNQLLQVIDGLERGCLQEQEQDHLQATFAPKIEVSEAQIDWNWSARQIHNLTRAMDPEPGAWCWISVKGQRKRAKLFASRYEENSLCAARQILELGQELKVGTAQGVISFGQIQIEGKPRMALRAFSAGYKVSDIQLSEPN